MFLPAAMMGIGEFAPALDVFLRQLSLDFVLRHSRFNKTQHAVESLRGDVNGLFEQFQLEIGFCDPQLMQQRREPTKVVQWVILLALADEADVACFHLDVGAFVLIAVQVGCIGLQHERAKRHREFGKPLDVFDARNLTRILFRVFISLPNFQVFVGFSQEKNLPVLLLGGIRENQKYALFLLNARKEKKIGIGMHHKRGIRIHRQKVVGVDHGQRLGSQ